MTRVKKGVHALKTRRNVLRQAKGYRFGRSKKERQAYEALAHAGAYSFAHRRDRKNDFRKMWNAKISAALSTTVPNTGKPISYSKFMGELKKQGIALNRKMLAALAQSNPDTFARVLLHVVH